VREISKRGGGHRVRVHDRQVREQEPLGRRGRSRAPRWEAPPASRPAMPARPAGRRRTPHTAGRRSPPSARTVRGDAWARGRVIRSPPMNTPTIRAGNPEWPASEVIAASSGLVPNVWTDVRCRRTCRIGRVAASSPDEALGAYKGAAAADRAADAPRDPIEAHDLCGTTAQRVTGTAFRPGDLPRSCDAPWLVRPTLVGGLAWPQAKGERAERPRVGRTRASGGGIWGVRVRRLLWSIATA
jgi:hypothetical protein